MNATMLLYSLAGAATISALISTVLHGLVYAALQSLSSSAYSIGVIPISLSAVNCVALVVLTVLVREHICSHQEWPSWKIPVASLICACFLTAAVLTPGTMTTNQSPGLHIGLLITRAAFRDISLFTQGLYSGYLLLSIFQQRKGSGWPRIHSLVPRAFPESSKTDPITPPPPAMHESLTEIIRFDTRRSSLRKYPRRSHRYSGGTICLHPSEQEKRASFDTTLASTSPIQSPLSEFGTDCGRHPLLQGDDPIRSISSIGQIKSYPSLDTLVQRSPSASSLNHEPSDPECEDHIHPLFRSSSPSPLPTAIRGTMVIVSPSAGQTITKEKETLTRMQSTGSLRDQM